MRWELTQLRSESWCDSSQPSCPGQRMMRVVKIEFEIYSRLSTHLLKYSDWNLYCKIFTHFLIITGFIKNAYYSHDWSEWKLPTIALRLGKLGNIVAETLCFLISFLYVCMVNTIYLLSFVDTPRKYIIAELSIRKLGSSSVLIIPLYY